jgi:syndecan 1
MPAPAAAPVVPGATDPPADIFSGHLDSIWKHLEFGRHYHHMAMQKRFGQMGGNGGGGGGGGAAAGGTKHARHQNNVRSSTGGRGNGGGRSHPNGNGRDSWILLATSYVTV